MATSSVHPNPDTAGERNLVDVAWGSVVDERDLLPLDDLNARFPQQE